MKKINFNKNWLFSLNDGEKTEIDLPHDFSIIQKRLPDAKSNQHGGFFQGGLGEYKKTFKAKKNKKYFFMCDGSFGLTEMYINYNSVFINKYPYNTFYVDITDFLRYDKENLITVVVNNRHQPNARWYTGAGIYRDTYLLECDNAYFSPLGIFVKTDEVQNNTAYMTVECDVFTDKKCEGVLEFEVFEDGNKTPVHTFNKYVFAEQGQNTIITKFQIDNPKIWDVDTPNMYSIKAKLNFDGIIDTDESVFGIRTVHIDSKKGFILNGKSIKLRGGCVHHDQGAVGSRTYAEIEYRRIKKLKEAGFNALRCSHNPQSQHFYDACDRLGMLVMDELFDYWTEGKQIEDYHSYFSDNYEKWIELIVKRNRKHPSIVMYSTGNEIPQKAGRGYGYRIARNIADNIRKYDTSRPLSHALCSLWDNSEAYEREKAENNFPSSKLDYFAEATKITADTVDIVGYNYLEYRLEKDLERFPNRVIINTETFPKCAYTTINQLKNNPRIAGDFVWTAYDYFGETAIGHIERTEREEGPFMFDYPYHIADCGDLDILGNRKPQSYYREISWDLRKEPYIAPRHPQYAGVKYRISGWGFYDCEHSWNFAGYEEKPVEVYVFAECDELILYVNGKEVGRQNRTSDGVYLFNTIYQSGEISAKAILNGKEYVSKITTEGEANKVALIKEKSSLSKYTKKQDDNIVIVSVEIQDENGKLCTQDARKIEYSSNGAEILGIATGNLIDESIYTSKERNVYHGKALVILKKLQKNATLTAKAQGIETETIEI